MIRRPPRSTLDRSSAASDVYKRQVGDLVRNVGGPRANVVDLMGAGVDPHLYTPTRDDVARIMGADVVFYLSLIHISEPTRPY